MLWISSRRYDRPETGGQPGRGLACLLREPGMSQGDHYISDMKQLFKLANLFGRNRTGDSDEQRTAILDAIEHIVDGTEPNIRLVSSYRKKLYQPVATALSYIDELVETIPGPIETSQKTFVSDPTVNAFFANALEMQTLFSDSTELRRFFDDNADPSLQEACALLCAREDQNNTFGMDLAGDVIQREVAQTAVNFSEHKVLAPAASASEARQGLKHCIFDGLITHTLQHLLTLKSKKQDLEDQRRILQSRLRARQAQSWGLSTLLVSVQMDPAAAKQIEEKLAKTERRLKHLPVKLDTPADYLNEVRQIVGHPEDFIRLTIVSFKLSKLGIRINDNSSQPANTVDLARIEIADVLKRTVALVCYPRQEMLPQRGLFENESEPPRS